MLPAMVTTEPRIAIEPIGPFSWEAALDVLAHWSPLSRHRPDAGGTLRLAFPLDGSFTPVAVALRFERGALRGEVAGSRDVGAVARQVARTFSLDHDGTGFPELGLRDPELGRVMAALPGLRPVCFTSPYEAAAWAIVSARIGMVQAAAVQDRLVAAHGHPLEAAGAEVRAFPTPERLLRVESVPGLSAEKVARLHGVASAALAGDLDVDRLRELGDDAGPAALRAIRGIGPFWSMGVYLRACGIVDHFPAEPLAVATLGRLHGLGERPDPSVLAPLIERFRPYRMWACFLLRVAGARGLIAGAPGQVPARRSRTGAKSSMKLSATET
jgi:DNA-3-methyladenine glycosylase II